MSFSDTKQTRAVLVCKKCNETVPDIITAKVVVSDDPFIQSGVYHSSCLPTYSNFNKEMRVYELLKYLFQIFQDCSLVEKFEDGDEQRVLLRFPSFARVL
jgi:hypothetical protein